MEDLSSADGYLPGLHYIKEELDLSNVTDDESMYSNDYEEECILGATNDKIVNTHLDHISDQSITNGDSNQVNVKNESSVNLDNTQNLDKFEVQTEKSTSNERVAIMGEESDTDVDVENDSSDDELNKKISQQENKIVTEESARECESSEEDFELKMSDDSLESDRLKITETDDSKTNGEQEDGKNECNSDGNDLDSSKTESRSYETRNRSKTQKVTKQSQKLKSQPGNRIVTRNFSNQILNKKRRAFTGTTNSIVHYCTNCCTSLKIQNTRSLVCSKCKQKMKYKCSLCKNKEHVTDTYCGIHKHITIHHRLKKKNNFRQARLRLQMSSKKKENIQTPTTTDSPKASENLQKLVFKRELVLPDIEKFTILICLKCNEVARVDNGKISDCSECKVKMILTCLICSHYEKTINGMYEHLHNKHQEHFSQKEPDNSKMSHAGESNKSEAKTSIIKNKKCLKCGRKFLSSVNASRHAKTCTGVTIVWKCDTCTYQTHFRSALKRHSRRLHKVEIENIDANKRVVSKNPTIPVTSKNQCRVCGKLCRDLISRKSHQKYCGLEPSIKCQYCPYKTKYKCNLNSHVNQNHSRKTPSVAAKSKPTKKVPFTPVTPIVKDTLKLKPQNTKKGLSLLPTVKPLKEVAEALCRKCNETKELIVNTKEIPCDKCETTLIYRCLVCDKGYEFYQSLMYHLDSSCNPKSLYQCRKCNYTTSVSNCMNKHIRIHGISPWQLSSATRHGKGCALKIEQNDVYNIVKFQESQPDHKYQKEKTPPIKNGQFNQENSKGQPEKNKTDELKKASLKRSALSDCNKKNQSLKSSCPKCNTMVLSLTKHLVFCGVEANISCKYCSYKTKYSFNLKAHVRKVHNKYASSKRVNDLRKSRQLKDETINNTDSDGTNNVLVNKDLKKNDAWQLKAEDLIQSYCSKCNASKETIKYASKCRVCESQLTYRCAKCKEIHPTREDLRVHVRLHWQKPFTCGTCRKSFGLIENLQMHEKICTGTNGSV